MSPLAPLHKHSGFSRDAALCLARLSDLAYQNDAVEILSGLKQMAGENAVRDLYDVRISLVEEDDAQALVISDAKVCVIAFRGSELHWKDWSRNFDATCTKYDDLPLHTGFLEAYLTLVKKIGNALHDHKVKDPAKRVFLTGHSQGGAIAGVSRVVAWAGVDVTVYTFNAPRFGGRQVRDYIRNRFSDRYFRVEFGNDIVSRIPRFFRWARFPLIPTPRRFYDTGCHMYVTKDGEILRSPSKVCLWWKRISGFQFDIFRNHLIGGLIKVLSK